MSSVDCDVEGIIASIQQIGDRCTRGVALVMVEEGNNIRDIARMYAPVDEGNLEESIICTAERTGQHGRTEVEILIDPDAVAINSAGNARSVAEYGDLMHEGLAPFGDGTYQLGPKSRQKGGAVGGQFLVRALADRYEILMDRVNKIINRTLS